MEEVFGTRHPAIDILHVLCNSARAEDIKVGLFPDNSD
jgi:hypothetical protein